MTIARAGSEIEIPNRGASDVATGRGYLTLPDAGSGPGIVVIQEWWGLVDHIRDVCDRLAREGFVALAPDLYRGEATQEPDTAQRLMMDLEIDHARGDLDASVAALMDHAAVRGSRVGAIGFCMGGQLALAAAASNPRIGAVVDCYGVHPAVTIDYTGLEAPVLGIFAENDEFVPPERVRALEAELADAGKRAHLRIFEGVDHAFLNDTRPDVYDAVAANEAWREILAFFRAEL